jgi:hypothetical protein
MNRRRIALRPAGARDARKMHRRDDDSPELRERIDRAITRDRCAQENPHRTREFKKCPDLKGFQH